MSVPIRYHEHPNRSSNNYASARLAGLEEDLNLSLTQYQTGLSILFVGYILGQIPSNLMLNWCGRPSWYLGFFTVAWGAVSALTALVQSFSGIIACRFILGFVGTSIRAIQLEVLLITRRGTIFPR